MHEKNWFLYHEGGSTTARNQTVAVLIKRTASLCGLILTYGESHQTVERGDTEHVGLDKLDSPIVAEKRDDIIVKSMTAGDVIQILADPSMGLREKPVGDTTLGAVLDELQKDPDFSGQVVNDPVTVGEIVDFLKTNQAVQAQRDKSFTVKMTVGEMLDILGEENVKSFVQRKTAEAAYKPEYESSTSNIVKNWLWLALFNCKRSCIYWRN